MTDLYPHWEKFRPNELLVREFEYWLVVARQKQITIGSCVFLLKRAVPSLGEVDSSELAELASVATWFEERLVTSLGAERFNYVAAMMKDPWFHLHAIPRFSSERTFGERSWQDQDWPALIKFRDVDTSNQELRQVVEFLRDDTHRQASR